jgi:hypothetical protein
MRYVVSEQWSRISPELKDVVAYYPDVSTLQLNQIQYRYLWRHLIHSSYIYTNGTEIKPVGWFSYAFQSLKGWLGFANHCHPNKVNYVLNKLAYYGYVHQFEQPNFNLLTNYTLDEKIKDLVQGTYTDSTTEALQNSLVAAYFNAEPYLGIPHPQLSAHHKFGESWLTLKIPELIPQLDPQDESLILRVIETFDNSGTEPSSFIKHSKFAQKMAQFYCNKAKQTPAPSLLSRLVTSDPRPGFLTKALKYDPNIASQEAYRFTEFYMQQRDFENAYRLLHLLTDTSIVLRHLLAMPETIRSSLVIKDSPTAAVLAKYYLGKKMYPQAQKIYTDIESLNPDAAFCIAIREEKYTYAYELFTRLQTTTTFTVSEMKTLAHRFSVLGENEYASGKIERNKKNWNSAETYYGQSLMYKKMAYHLHPSAENLANVQAHKRLYANLLVDRDVDLHKPEDSDLANILKAITMLHECKPHNNEEKRYHQKALAKALMRRVDTLMEKISFTYTPDSSGVRDHKKEHQGEIDAFIKTLEELIALLRGTKDRDLRGMLGKAYFLLADIKDMFDIPDPDIHKNYQLAQVSVPQNPFYILRVAEIFEDENHEKLINKGLPKLRALGYDAMDFYNWSNERWVKRDNIIHKIKDIHAPALESETTSWLKMSW